MIERVLAPSLEAVMLLAIEVWTPQGGWRERLAPPPPCRAIETPRGRWLAVGSRLRWLTANRNEAFDELTRVLDGAGAVFDISGSMRRLRIEARDWRDRLSVGGVLDTRAQTLPPGAVAASVLHHAPVRLDVIDEYTVDLYTPPSFADHLLHHLK